VAGPYTFLEGPAGRPDQYACFRPLPFSAGTRPHSRCRGLRNGLPQAGWYRQTRPCWPATSTGICGVSRRSRRLSGPWAYSTQLTPCIRQDITLAGVLHIVLRGRHQTGHPGGRGPSPPNTRATIPGRSTAATATSARCKRAPLRPSTAGRAGLRLGPASDAAGIRD